MILYKKPEMKKFYYIYSDHGDESSLKNKITATWFSQSAGICEVLCWGLMNNSNDRKDKDRMN